MQHLDDVAKGDQVFDLECTNPSSLRATLFTSVRSLKRALTSLLPGDSATDSPTDPA